MKNKKISTAFILISILIASMVGCNTKPEMTIGVPSESNSDIAQLPENEISGSQTEHKVIVKDTLNTERYSYLNVAENGNDFWIAIQKRNVQIGGTYYFSGAILKRNFESKEFNKVFDTIYLVSNFAPHPIESGSLISNEEISGGQASETNNNNNNTDDGSVKISELYSNPSEYEGKIIRVSGRCIKVNPMIMNRNWVHIQDGSSEDHDLTVTTTSNIDVGLNVTFEGTISLNKDFGAGYVYEIIMENATVIQ